MLHKMRFSYKFMYSREEYLMPCPITIDILRKEKDRKNIPNEERLSPIINVKIVPGSNQINYTLLAL